MITRTLRRAMKREEGQALVVACLMILVITVAVLSTVNIGQNIHERQRLQNTADAAAYSMAALEARAFNYYAFVNRTHVSHYVSAMTWQSIDSFAYFVEAMLVDVYGVMRTVSCETGTSDDVIKSICKFIATFNSTLQQVQSFIDQWDEMYRRLLYAVLLYMRTADPDRAIGQTVVPTYFTMNAMLTASAEATLKAALEEVELTSMQVVMANDKNIDMTSARIMSGRLSKCMLARAHMREALHGESSNLPYDDVPAPLDPSISRDTEKVARAKRAMGSISNATRFALDEKNNPDEAPAPGPGWTTDRKFQYLVEFPPSFEPIKQILVDYVDDPNGRGPARLGKWGQTKMLTGSPFNGRPTALPNGGGNNIRHWKDPPNAPWGEMAQGDDVGSDDLYRINIGDWNQKWELNILGLGLASMENKHLLSCRTVDNPMECWGDNRYDRNRGDNMWLENMLKTSIWATNLKEPVHYRLVSMLGGVPNPKIAFDMYRSPSAPLNYEPGNYLSELGLSRVDIKLQAKVLGFTVAEPTMKKWVANIRGMEDGNHPWPGVAPFPHFEPQQYQQRCDPGPVRPALLTDRKAALRDVGFNQPSTFAMLEKNPSQLLNPGDDTGAGNNKPALLNSQGSLDFKFSRQTPKLVMDNTRKTFMTGEKGLHVLSRGQTYYHRPGNWNEQANFFNPYWRPRLGSVLQGQYGNPAIDDFIKMLPAPLSDAPQRAIVH